MKPAQQGAPTLPNRDVRRVGGSGNMTITLFWPSRNIFYSRGNKMLLQNPMFDKTAYQASF